MTINHDIHETLCEILERAFEEYLDKECDLEIYEDNYIDPNLLLHSFSRC